MKQFSSPNVVEMSRIIASLGGTVTEVRGGGKHIKMYVVTSQGNSLVIPVSKSKIEPYKLKGWARQQFNKADARVKP